MSWEVAEALKSLGHDALHVRDLGMAAAEDQAILQRAHQDQRTIITQDTDYGTLLVTSDAIRVSVILFRMRDGRPQSQIALLKQILPDIQSELEAGCIVVVGDGTIRIRKLQ